MSRQRNWSSSRSVISTPVEKPHRLEKKVVCTNIPRMKQTVRKIDSNKSQSRNSASFFAWHGEIRKILLKDILAFFTRILRVFSANQMKKMLWQWENLTDVGIYSVITPASLILKRNWIVELYLRLNAKTVLSVNIKHKKMMLQKGGTESCQIIKLKKRGWITIMVVQWNDSKQAWWPRVKPRNIVLIMMKPFRP